MKKEEMFRPNGKFKRGHPVPEEWREAVSRTQKGCKRSKEFREKRKEAQRRLWKNLEYRKRVSQLLSISLKGRRFSSKSRRRMSDGQKKRFKHGLHPTKGKKLPMLRGMRNPAKRPEVRKKISQKMSAILKSRPELQLNAKLAKKKRGTRPEQILLIIAKKVYPDAQLNYYIPRTTRFADVGIPSEKLDIEYDEDYWHQDKEKDKKRDQEILSVGWAIAHLKRHNLEDLMEIWNIREPF